MKVWLIAGGIILVLTAIVPLHRKVEEYDVQKRGNLVTVRLTQVPAPIGCKIKYFIKFIYTNREYSKRAGCDFVEHHKTGESIQFRHKDGSDIFLFLDEDVKKEFIADIALALVGIGFIIYGLRKLY